MSDPSSTDTIPGGGNSRGRLLHRMWVVPVVTVLGLIGGFVYLAVVKPVYAVEATLAISNRDLTREIGAVKLAAAKVDDPAGILRKLRVRALPKTGLLVLSVDATEPKQAAELINRVVDRYVNAPPAEPATEASNSQVAQLIAQRKNAHSALTEFTKDNPGLSDEALKPLRDRLAALTQAVTNAQLSAASAKATLDATGPMLEDPAKAADLISANRARGIFRSLDRQTAEIQNELAPLEQDLEEQKKTMLPQNPTRIATQKQVDAVRKRLATQQQRYVEVYRTVLEQDWRTALNKQRDVEKLADQQKQELNATEARLAKLHALEATAKAADHALAQATGQPETDVADVRIVATAQAPAKPIRPDRETVMWIAMAIGVIVGLVLSFVRVGGP